MFDDNQPNNQSGAPPSNLPVGGGAANPAPAEQPQSAAGQSAQPSSSTQPESPTKSTAQPGQSAVAAGMLQPKQSGDVSAQSGVEDLPDAFEHAASTQQQSASNVAVQAAGGLKATPQPAAQPGAVFGGGSATQQPHMASGPQLPKAPQAQQTTAQPEYDVKKPGAAKIIIFIIIVLLLVAGIIAVGWWFYTNYFVAEEPQPVSQQEQETVPSSIETETTTEQTVGTGNEIVDDILLFGQPTDTDEDGLDDAREETLGTDPDDWDSDDDELSDGDEVLIWNTDPLDEDTDDDGYLDGGEVRAGYSPLGPGRIFEPPTTNQETSTEDQMQNDATTTPQTDENTTTTDDTTQQTNTTTP